MKRKLVVKARQKCKKNRKTKLSTMMDGSMIIHMYQNRKMKRKWVAKTRQKRKLKLKTMVDRKIIILMCQNIKLNGNWWKTMAERNH